MGQYYKPCILSENKRKVLYYFDAHSFGEGLKFMEHSYIGNDLVNAVEQELFKNKQYFTWAGDYADPINKEGETYYNLCSEAEEIFKTKKIIKANFIVNHTKKEFIDKSKTPISNDFYQLHPLPFMTVNKETVGRGGGDFYINKEREQGNIDLIGRWETDLISIEADRPKEPEFTELFFNIIEG